MTGTSAQMYVCGITPYDATHLGHAATFVAFDLVVRQWRDGGIHVRYVQNVTDVDDPLLERARADGVDWVDLGSAQLTRFRADMEALRVLPPQEYVSVVEAMPEIVLMVDKLLSKGAAYRLVGHRYSDVYFDNRSAPGFGQLSRYDRATMVNLLRRHRGDPDRPGKRDPLDALLWRVARPGEPSWPAPFGSGRPGWHVGCSAIALSWLGAGFDLQGGGPDLVFPHHEFSRAHSCALTDTDEFARYYCHTGPVMLGGQTMSKSRGNLYFVRDVLHSVEPAVLRLALLASHYRAPQEWTPDLLSHAAARLVLWRQAVRSGRGPAAEPLLAEVRRQLANDLDSPATLDAVDAWAVEALRRGSDHPHASGTVRDMVDALLGVAL